jgi:hypothetical protein
MGVSRFKHGMPASLNFVYPRCDMHSIFRGINVSYINSQELFPTVP